MKPAQHQERQPGRERRMRPRPVFIRAGYRGAGKLQDKVAIVTGGDSGIGRAVCVHFAREGADVVIVYLEEHEDARETRRLVEAEGRRCTLIAGDVGDLDFCAEVVLHTLEVHDRIDVLVNNAGEMHEQLEPTDISPEKLLRTFRTNVFAFFYLTQLVLPHLRPGCTIINTTSITAFRGSKHLLDYSATKGAIASFTRSLSQMLVDKGIRVNAVAPGPVWTPLIPAAFGAAEVAEFGKQVPMRRPAEPAEIAPAYVFLACEDSSYMTGQTLHPTGGVVID